MITASDAAKLAFAHNYRDIQQPKQLEDIFTQIESAAKKGESSIQIKFLLGENKNQLNSMGYSLHSVAGDITFISW